MLMTLPPGALGPQNPYRQWLMSLSRPLRIKELLRFHSLKKAEGGEEIPIPAIFAKGTLYVFEYDCPCLLWPDDQSYRMPVHLPALEGSFTCAYCQREWNIAGWNYILEGSGEEWHPRVLHCFLVGTTSRLRLLVSNEEVVRLKPKVSVPLKLALLLRTSDDD